MMAYLPPALLLIVVAATLHATVQDVRFRIIPNLDCLLVLLAGFGWLQAAHGFGVSQTSLLVAAIAVVLGTWAHSRKLVGGGDVKLFVATVIWLPPSVLPQYLLYGSIGSLVTSVAIRIVSYRNPGANHAVPVAVPLLLGLLAVIQRLLGG